MQGQGGISLDNIDAIKFITVSTNPFVQTAIRDHQHAPAGEQGTNLLALAARRCQAQYPTDASWPTDTRPWYTIKDGPAKLKGEAMKTAIMLGQADQYLVGPLTATQRNLMVHTAPPHYKYLMMTLLLAETGNPVETVLEKMMEVGEMGEWSECMNNGTGKDSD